MSIAYTIYKFQFYVGNKLSEFSNTHSNNLFNISKIKKHKLILLHINKKEDYINYYLIIILIVKNNHV